MKIQYYRVRSTMLALAATVLVIYTWLLSRFGSDSQVSPSYNAAAAQTPPHQLKPPLGIPKISKKRIIEDSVVHPTLFTAGLNGFPAPQTSTSTTIIFNLFKGPPSNLRQQLAKACSQTSPVSSVWVFAFAAPVELENEYRLVSQEANMSSECVASKVSVTFTSSEFNFKFHGRFLLAPMAAAAAATASDVESKYLMIVDDDVVLTRNIVKEFVEHMAVKPRLLGTAGQLRGPRKGVEPGWQHPTSPTLLKSNLQDGDQPHVDYLCNIWFMKTAWVTATFLRDHPLTWYTGEDIHLSFVIKKYLGIDSAVIRITPDDATESPMDLESKKHVAHHEKRVADVRNDMFRVNLGRGFVPDLGGVIVKTLVFVQDLETAAAFLETYKTERSKKQDGFWGALREPSCMVFTGRETSSERIDLLRMVALEYSEEANCKLFLRPKWGAQPRAVRYFDMRLGLDLTDDEYPLSTMVSDIIPAMTGILGGGIELGVVDTLVTVTRTGSTGSVIKQGIKLVVAMFNDKHGGKNIDKPLEVVEFEV
ncbi:hypothetical protein BDR26DRAFT_864983 [Obelidium mucronatum]|nr:hypothetical protein BDR26DRAFT_864983 [Obelidium mucronatum]